MRHDAILAKSAAVGYDDVIGRENWASGDSDIALDLFQAVLNA